MQGVGWIEIRRTDRDKSFAGLTSASDLQHRSSFEQAGIFEASKLFEPYRLALLYLVFHIMLHTKFRTSHKIYKVSVNREQCETLRFE